MADWIYVDHSNVLIEGKRVAAVNDGQEKSIQDAMQKGTLKQSWSISFGGLYDVITSQNPSSIARAVIYGSSPAETDPIWDMARDHKFEVKIIPRNAANKEKKIDTSIVTELMADALSNAVDGDMFILVSGDSDFVPPVKMLTSLNKSVDVYFWSHGSRELIDTSTEFHSLNGHFARLTL